MRIHIIYFLTLALFLTSSVYAENGKKIKVEGYIISDGFFFDKRVHGAMVSILSENRNKLETYFTSEDGHFKIEAPLSAVYILVSKGNTVKEIDIPELKKQNGQILLFSKLSSILNILERIYIYLGPFLGGLLGWFLSNRQYKKEREQTKKQLEEIYLRNFNGKIEKLSDVIIYSEEITKKLHEDICELIVQILEEISKIKDSKEHLSLSAPDIVPKIEEYEDIVSKLKYQFEREDYHFDIINNILKKSKEGKTLMNALRNDSKKQYIKILNEILRILDNQ